MFRYLRESRVQVSVFMKIAHRIKTEHTNSSQHTRMCCWSKTNSVLRVSRRIILQRSHVVNTPRGPEGPADSSPAASQACTCLCEVTLPSRKGGWRSAQSVSLPPRRVPVGSSFVSASLPKHVGRFQGVEITRWSSGACRRAGPAGWSPHESAVFWGTPPAYQAYRGFLPGFLQRNV